MKRSTAPLRALLPWLLCAGAAVPACKSKEQAEPGFLLRVSLSPRFDRRLVKGVEIVFDSAPGGAPLLLDGVKSGDAQSAGLRFTTGPKNVDRDAENEYLITIPSNVFEKSNFFEMLLASPGWLTQEFTARVNITGERGVLGSSSAERLPSGEALLFAPRARRVLSIVLDCQPDVSCLPPDGTPNRPPVLAPLAAEPLDLRRERTLTLTLSATDADSDPLTYAADPTSLANLPGATFDAATRTFSWRPPASAVRPEPWVASFSVSDGRGGTDTKTLSVRVNATNSSPAWSPIGDKLGAEGQRLVVPLSATDPDGDRLDVRLDKSGLPPGADALIDASTGELVWTPQRGDGRATPWVVRAIAKDPTGAEASVSFSVLVAKVNRNPTLTAPETLTVRAGRGVVLPIVAADLDGDAVTVTADLSALPSPNDALFDAAAGLFSWTPSRAALRAEPWVITLSATDGRGGSTARRVRLLVNDENSAPVWTPLPPAVVREGRPMVLRVRATDPDGDALTLTADTSGLPAGAAPSFSQSGAGEATLEWLPAGGSSRDAGYRVVLTAVDAKGATTSAEAFVIVLPLVSSPVPDAAPPQPGTALTFSDVRTSALTVSWGVATDNETAGASLQYKLVRAPFAGALAFVEGADALTGDAVVMDYTANVTTREVTGLQAGVTVWFAVLVRDAAGNRALYPAASALAGDVKAPTIGSGFVFERVTERSLTVRWGTATDDGTAPAELRYRLVRAASAADIDSVAKVAARTTDVLLDWGAHPQSVNVAGLTPGATYWFAVAVRDTAGNAALYPPTAVTPPDFTAPVPPGAPTLADVTGTGVTVSWSPAMDAAPAERLEYRVVYATSASALATPAMVEAAVPPALAQDWASMTSVRVSGLSPGVTYWFAVAARDPSGNVSLYPLVSTSTTGDITPPVPGDGLTFAAVRERSLNVSWGAATDNVSPQAALSYRLVRASTAGAVDTIAEIDAITGPALLLDWTVAQTQVSVTGLSANTLYWFAVAARDAAGNEAVVALASLRTSDETAPVPGGPLALTPTDSSVAASWPAAIDNVTVPAALEYRVVYSAVRDDVRTVLDAEQVTGSGVVRDWAPAFTSATATGLTSGVNYWFAVLVRDELGNRALYGPTIATTLDILAPVPGTGPTFSNVTATGLTVQWTAATDNATPPSSLRYRVVSALSSPSQIDTIAEVVALTGPGVLRDWTASLAPLTVTSLSAGQTIYVTVVVEDLAGNRAIYLPQPMTTPFQPPTIFPAAGTYEGSVLVSLSSVAPEALIYYTTDGTTPTAASTRLTAPLTLTATTTVRAIAIGPGGTTTTEATSTFNIEHTLRVAPTGNDVTGDGTASAPFASPGRAATVAAGLAGTKKIRVATGVYTLTNGVTVPTGTFFEGGYAPPNWTDRNSVANPVTFQAPPTGSAVTLAAGGVNIDGIQVVGDFSDAALHTCFTVNGGVLSNNRCTLTIGGNASANGIATGGPAVSIVEKNVVNISAGSGPNNSINGIFVSGDSAIVRWNRVRAVYNGRYVYALYANGSGTTNTLEIYGNVLQGYSPSSVVNGGATLFVGNRATGSTVRIANNTLRGGTTSVNGFTYRVIDLANQTNPAVVAIENNLVFSVNASLANNACILAPTFTSLRNNDLFDCPGGLYSDGVASPLTTAAQVNALPNAGGNISFSLITGANDYFVDESTDFHLTSNSNPSFAPVKSGGREITVALQYSYDLDNVTRTAGGGLGWSMGAYEQDL